MSQFPESTMVIVHTYILDYPYLCHCMTWVDFPGQRTRVKVMSECVIVSFAREASYDHSNELI